LTRREDRLPTGLRAFATLKNVPLPGDWAGRAACRDVLPTLAEDKRMHLFFPTRGVNGAPEWFVELCAGCPVYGDCLAYSLRWPVTGLWAGTTEDERVRWRKAQRRRAS
jgi:hypothetical protein